MTCPRPESNRDLKLRRFAPYPLGNEGFARNPTQAAS